jgi:hypothetical protein
MQGSGAVLTMHDQLGEMDTLVETTVAMSICICPGEALATEGV